VPRLGLVEIHSKIWKKNGVLRSWYVGKQRRCRDWNRTGFAGWVKEQQDSHARLKHRECPGERPWLMAYFSKISEPDFQVPIDIEYGIS
jgi:hypothetical protein